MMFTAKVMFKIQGKNIGVSVWDTHKLQNSRAHKKSNPTLTYGLDANFRMRSQCRVIQKLTSNPASNKRSKYSRTLWSPIICLATSDERNATFPYEKSNPKMRHLAQHCVLLNMRIQWDENERCACEVYIFAANARSLKIQT